MHANSVAPVRGSTVIVPLSATLMPLPSRKAMSGRWPMATMIESAAISNSLPSIGIGLRRPSAPGSVRRFRTQTSDFTRPPSVRRIRFGETSSMMLFPSMSSSSTSSYAAGISARVRRYTTVTGEDAIRAAVRAASIAVLPPPITSTFEPRSIASPRFARASRSRAKKTRSAPTPTVSIPSMSSFASS